MSTAILASSSVTNFVAICRASSLSTVAFVAAACQASSSSVIVCSITTTFSVACMIHSFCASDVFISSTSGVCVLSIPTSMVSAQSTADSTGEAATVGVPGGLAAATGFSALPTGDSLEIGALANGILDISAGLFTMGGNVFVGYIIPCHLSRALFCATSFSYQCPMSIRAS